MLFVSKMFSNKLFVNLQFINLQFGNKLFVNLQFVNLQFGNKLFINLRFVNKLGLLKRSVAATALFPTRPLFRIPLTFSFSLVAWISQTVCLC